MIVYPKCSELVIEYVAANIKPLCMTTAQFRDYFDVWEEQLENYQQQQDMWGKDVNLVAFFARWCEDMYSDGLHGLQVLYDAEQYERPRAISQFAFPFTYGGRQYDMTFAVHVVRRMFLRVRPDLQASIAGLENRDLLQKMEDSIGGDAAMANSPDRLSSLLRQLQALNSSDLRLLPETQEQTQYRVEREQWDRVKNLISNILKDPELQRDHTQVQSVLIKCQEALTKLRLYGSVDYQDAAQAIVQNESVFNQLVDNIKLVYTLDNKNVYSPKTNPNGYSPKILAALESIVNKIIRIGRDMRFIKQLELETESDWPVIIAGAIKYLDDYLYIQRDAHSQGLQNLRVLCPKLDTQLRQFTARPTTLNIYNRLVAEVMSFYHAKNFESVPYGTTRTLHTIIMCLMGYGRKYGFKLNQIEAMDRWYWQCLNPHGYGMS